MTRLAYRLDQEDAPKAALGLVVLRADETIDREFRRLIPFDQAELYTTRIASGDAVTSETLSTMEAALPAAAGLFPAQTCLDVIGYACTSGAAVIGSDTVARLVRSAARVRHVTDPLTATIAACHTLGVRRLGFVTPYVADVSATIRKRIEGAGITIAGFGSFEEEEEAKVARIDPASILDAAIATARAAPCDGVFLSCTNLRTLDVIEKAEAALGRPVITSNQALAWHMLQLAGPLGAQRRPGRLMNTALQDRALQTGG